MATTRAPQAWLDTQLTSAIQSGPAALPADLNRLHGYLGLVVGLLAEKAQDCEPDWAGAVSAAAEIEALFRIEDAVAERAIGVPARNLWAVLTKLEIWGDLSPDGDDDPLRQRRDRLIESVRRDITHIARSARSRPLGAGPY